MTDIYLHFLRAHYRLSGNAPVDVLVTLCGCLLAWCVHGARRCTAWTMTHLRLGLAVLPRTALTMMPVTTHCLSPSGNARIKNVCKSQSCMVSKIRMMPVTTPCLSPSANLPPCRHRRPRRHRRHRRHRHSRANKGIARSSTGTIAPRQLSAAVRMYAHQNCM